MVLARDSISGGFTYQGCCHHICLKASLPCLLYIGILALQLQFSTELVYSAVPGQLKTKQTSKRKNMKGVQAPSHMDTRKKLMGQKKENPRLLYIVHSEL
jgi:hypothetical protein